jgi:hypothetical protein
MACCVGSALSDVASDDAPGGVASAGALPSIGMGAEPGLEALEEGGAFTEGGAPAAAFDEGTGDSERILRLLSQTGVKKPDKRSNSPTLKLFEGLDGSMSRSSVVMLFPGGSICSTRWWA